MSDLDESGAESSGQEDDIPVESSSEDEEREKPKSRSASPQAPRGDDDLASTIRKTRDEDRLKGIAVSRQIVRIDFISLA